MDGEIILVPYVEIDGRRTISDQEILAMFSDMISQSLVEKVFSDGLIKMDKEFLALMKSSSNHAVFAHINGQFRGFAWLNNVQNNHACAHFCFLRGAWGDTAVEAATKILDYWFEFETKMGKKMFDVLVGYTPVTNQAAVKFVQKIGFVRVGEIPFLCLDAKNKQNVSALLTYKTREA